jgi:hypothetical protein
MATIDTLQDAVNTLTSSTTSLLDEVSTSKTYLDAAKDSAEDARDTALTHKTGAETAKTGAEAARDLAYSYQQSAASAVAYQDLAAIAESKNVTAKDVFVYDTRKDSDGGAWRKRTQHTSWYNETLNTSTRGSRKEFPAVAVIVMEAYKLTIYDGDDPALPMWMVFENAGSLSWASNSTVLYNSVMAVNGIVVPVSVAGSVIYDFGKDDTRLVGVNAYELSSNKALVARNGATSWVSGGNGLAIVNSQINDVAMTVLPNAPIDSATGLPVPTIAVATNGGVSVIKDDGTVVDIARSSRAYGAVQFAGESLWTLETIGSASCWIYFETIPTADISPTTQPSFVSSVYSSNYLLPSDSYDEAAGDNEAKLYVGGSSDLTVISGTTTQKSADSSVAYITSSYNTGWMNGDIKLATLSDTDDADVTGTELVTNGTFDIDTSGWSGHNGATLSVVSGALRATNDGSTSYPYVQQSITTEVGKTYTVSARALTSPSHNWYIEVNGLGSSAQSQDEFQSHTFTATSTSAAIRLIHRGAANGDYKDFDDVTCRLAEDDRSVNGNGLQVFGTVTKNPVATGADLVAYSGFNTSNYLEQPYNSDLDFGTGDFCVMGWYKSGYDNGALQWLFERDSAKLEVFTFSGSGIMRVSLAGTVVESDASLFTGTWINVCIVRRQGATSIYLNAELKNTASLPADINTTTSAPLSFGARNDGTYPTTASLALWRISATAPTAEQIAKIYEDEKVLFQENAKATLYGSSDAVTALAYDDDTELLHVGTSAGRSDFQGLRRVSNTTDAVGAAISASNGLIAED